MYVIKLMVNLQYLDKILYTVESVNYIDCKTIRPFSHLAVYNYSDEINLFI